MVLNLAMFLPYVLRGLQLIVGRWIFSPNDVWEMMEDVVPCHQLSTPNHGPPLPKSIYRNTAEKA